MINKYTSEENVLQLISLLKAHGIKKIIASPGNTNITFVGSVQNDDFFEIYSCVDERSAAYMACGMAEESGEPVAISCTGATAARNYPSGLTEAYYRKLPVLAITSSQPFGRVGQLYPQFTDRNVQFNDMVTMSVQIPYPHSEEERWSNNVKINSAILQLSRRPGAGPVHINIETHFSRDFYNKKLPKERVIRRYFGTDDMPNIIANKVCIFVGAHHKFEKNLDEAVDDFCEKYNAIVLCDQTSNYKGRYRVLGGLVACQMEYHASCRDADLIIHLGEISGAYYSFNRTEIWRVNPDGEVRDPFRMLTKVFQMDELSFFEYYNRKKDKKDNTYLYEWKNEINRIKNAIPELPLSNVWMCQQTASKLPRDSVLHLGILNSLRSWNLFDVQNNIYSYSNVGGFGIDGCLSTCIGAALANKDKLFFCVIGDLAAFYDINILGNRHVSNNVRIIISNNGTGYEMHCSGSIGSCFEDSEADRFFAAGGHNGNKSRNVLRHLAEDLGFEYMKAESKEEYLEHLSYFVSEESHDKPIIFEVFLDPQDDDFAYNATRKTIISSSATTKRIVKDVLGDKGVSTLKKIINRP